MVLNLPHVQWWFALIRCAALAVAALSYPRDRWELSIVALWMGFAAYGVMTMVPLVAKIPAFLSRDLTVAADAALASLLVFVTGGMTSPCIFMLYLPVMEAALGISFSYAVIMALWTLGWMLFLGNTYGFPAPAQLTLFQRSYAFGSTAVCLAAAFRALHQVALKTELELSRLKDERAALADLADRDSLTGALNRRAFDRMLEEEIRASKEGGAPLSLILIDVDDMKEINDIRGHEAGDVALMTLVDHLNKYSREGDGVFRYGGDEFAVLLPNADSDAAAQWVVRARENLKETLPRFSVGGATFPETASDGPGLLRAADAALYAEKSKKSSVWRRDLFGSDSNRSGAG